MEHGAANVEPNPSGIIKFEMDYRWPYGNLTHET